MKRGDVWWVEFDPAVGSEIRKTKPAVIVSNDAANRNLARVVVVPLTSRTDRIYPGEAVVTAGGQKSTAMSDQIMTADKARLKNQIEALSLSPASWLLQKQGSAGVPRVEERNTAWLKVSHIPRYDGHSVYKSSRGDQRVADWARVRHMESGAALRNGGIDSHYAATKSWQDVTGQPRPKQSPLGRIATFDEQHADFQFLQGNHRQIHVAGISSVGPGGDVSIRLPGTNLS